MANASVKLPLNLTMILNQSERLELKLFKLQFAVAFELCNVSLEIVGGGVCSESFGVGPSFAEHEHIAARAAFEHVVRDATFVLLASSGESERSLKRSFVLAFVGLVETVDTDHNE